MNDDLIIGIAQTVGRLEAKLDAYHNDMKSVKVRVRRLEVKWTKVSAVFGLLTLPFTALVTYLKRT